MQRAINKHVILLRPLLDSDSASIYIWHNDIEITLYSQNSLVMPQNEEDVHQFIEKQKSERIITFGIEYDGVLVGYIGLSNINTINRSAEFFILIGEKKYWGKNIGFHSGRMILEYGFNSLNLHRIDLSVSDLNIRAVKLYEKLGFIHEGIKRDACFREGKYHNKLIMGMIRTEPNNKAIS